MRILFFSMYMPLSVSILSVLIAACTSWYFGIVSIIAAFDAISRAKEAIRFRRHKITERLMQRFQHSRCQRNAMIGIAGSKAREYYRSLGYKWYSILPNVMMKDPLRFFSYKFLRKAFFPF